jgi:hypothetical protein
MSLEKNLVYVGIFLNYFSRHILSNRSFVFYSSCRVVTEENNAIRGIVLAVAEQRDEDKELTKHVDAIGGCYGQNMTLMYKIRR